MKRSGMKGVALDRRVRQIFCCGCGADVEARLTSGAEIYPHRDDTAKTRTIEEARAAYRAAAKYA